MPLYGQTFHPYRRGNLGMEKVQINIENNDKQSDERNQVNMNDDMESDEINKIGENREETLNRYIEVLKIRRLSS